MGGDIAMASKILAAQAIARDSMFAKLAQRAGPQHGRVAQSNCRATLEALAKLQQGQAAIRMTRLG
jgi:hypothetical protein